MPRTSPKRQVLTHDGHPLSPSEAKFIDKYMETGNASESFVYAYPKSNPKTASQRGYALFNKHYIASEIAYRTELAKNESIANAQEIMQYFTDVMRGQIKDQFGLEAPLSERTKAAQELAKRQIDIANRLQEREVPEIKITLDWERGRAKAQSEPDPNQNAPESTES